MSITKAIGALGPLAKLLTKGLELIDPKTRDWVHKRKALEWAEKYIHKNDELLPLLLKEEKTEKDKVKIRRLMKSLKYLRRWFFQMD